jgi:hypothetical protein
VQHLPLEHACSHTCDRYDLTFESPEYDPFSKTCIKKEASMTDSWGILKAPGELHPKQRKVCNLGQKEMEIKKLTVRYSDTSAKLQYLFIVFDDSSLLADLNRNANLYYLNVFSVIAMMWYKGLVDAVTLASN